MKNFLLGMAIVIALFIAGYTVGLWWQNNKERDVEYKPELCEVGRIDHDGNLVYSQEYGGSTDFTVIMTSRGPKLFAECKE